MKLEEWGSLILSWANFLDINEEISSLEELACSNLFSRLLRVLTKTDGGNVDHDGYLGYLQEQYSAVDFGSKQSRCNDDTILMATVFLIYCSLHDEGNDLRQKMTELPHWTQLCLSDFLQELVEVSKSSITREMIFSEISKIDSSRIPQSEKPTSSPQFGTPLIYSSTPSTNESSKTSSSKKASKLKRLRTEIEALNNLKVELTEELESAKESILRLEGTVQRKDQEIYKLKSDLKKAENTDHVCEISTFNVSDSRENKKLIATVDSLEQTIAKLKEEVEVTRQEREEAHEEVQKSKNRLQKAIMDIKLYDDERVEYENKIKGLKYEVEQLTFTIKEQSEYISELRTKEDSKTFSDSQSESLILPETLGQQVIDLEIRELKDLIDAKESKIKLLDGQLQEQMNFINNLETKLEESKKEYDIAREKFTNKEKSLLAKIEFQTATINTNEEDYKTLEHKYSDLMNALQEKDTKIINMQSDIDLLKKENISFNNTNNTLKGEMESKDTFICQLKREFENLKIINNENLLEIDSLNKLTADKESDLQRSYYELNEARTSFQIEINELKRKCANEIQSIKDQMVSARTKLKMIDDEYTNLIRQLQAEVKDLKVLEERTYKDLVDCQEKMKAMNETLTEKASHIFKLEKEIINLSSKNSALCSEKQVLDLKVSENINIIKTLEDKLHDKDIQVKEREGQLIKQDTEFNSTLNSLLDKFSGLQHEICELNNEKESISLMLSTKETELSEAKSQIISLKNVIENNKSEIITLTEKIKQKECDFQDKLAYIKEFESKAKTEISSLKYNTGRYMSQASRLEYENIQLKEDVKNSNLEIESHLGKLIEFEKEHSGCKEQIHFSQTVIRELADKEAILKEQLVKSNEREMSLKAELRTSNSVIANLRKELDDNVNSRENAISCYEENINKKEAELSELRSQINSLKETLVAKTSENRQLLLNIEEKNLKINELKCIETDYTTSITTLTSEAEREADLKATLEREITDLKNKIKEVEIEHSSYKERIQYSDSVIHELKDKENILKDLLNQSKETEQTLVHDINNKLSIISNLEEEIKSLKKNILDHKFEEGILVTKVQVKDAEINEMKLKLGEINKQLKVNEDKFQEEIKHHVEKIHSLDSTIGKLNNQFVKVNRDRETLISELDEKSSVQKDMKSLQSQYDKLKREYNEIGKDLISKSNEASRLVLKVKSFEKDIELLKTEKNQQVSKLESKDKKILQLESAIQKLETEVSEVSLKQQESSNAILEKNIKKIEVMEGKISSLEDDNLKLKLKSSEQEQTITSLYKTLQSQNSDLKDKDKVITILKNNAKMLNEELMKEKECKSSNGTHRNFRSLTENEEGKTLFTKEEVQCQIQEVKANCEKQIDTMRAAMTKRFPEKLQELTRSLQNQVASLRDENRKVEDRCASLQSELWGTSDKLLIAQEEYRTLLRSLKSRNKFEVIRPGETLSPISKAKSMEVLSGRNRGIDNFARDISLNESTSSSRRSSIRSLPRGMGKVFPAAEEDGEVFDNRYLADLKEGICNVPIMDSDRMSTLRYRNSLCPPHLKSSYPAETQFINNLKEEELKVGTHPLSASSETDMRKIKVQGNEKTSFAALKSSGRIEEGVVNESFVLRETNNRKTDNPPVGRPTKVSTPSRLKALFTNRKDENSPKRRSTLFKRN